MSTISQTPEDLRWLEPYSVDFLPEESSSNLTEPSHHQPRNAQGDQREHVRSVPHNSADLASPSDPGQVLRYHALEVDTPQDTGDFDDDSDTSDISEIWSDVTSMSEEDDVPFPPLPSRAATPWLTLVTIQEPEDRPFAPLPRRIGTAPQPTLDPREDDRPFAAPLSVKQEAHAEDLTYLPPRAARKQVMTYIEVESEDEDEDEDEYEGDVSDPEYNPSKPMGPRKRKNASAWSPRKRSTPSGSSSSGSASSSISPSSASSPSPSSSGSSLTSASRSPATSPLSIESTSSSDRARTVKKPAAPEEPINAKVRTKTSRTRKASIKSDLSDPPNCRVIQTNYDCSEGFNAKQVDWDEDNKSPCLVAGCSYVFLRHRCPDAKRHLVAHSRQWRYAHSLGLWVCRGVLVPEGEAPKEYDAYLYKGQWRYGGCLTRLSRRDALVRHLRKFPCVGTACQTD